MSTLRSALDELGAEDLRRAAEIDRRGSFRRDGYLSISSWIAHRFCMAFSAATQLVCVERAFEHMPWTCEALAGGEISRSAAAVMVAAREVDPADFSRVEEALVDMAGTLPIRDLKRAVAHWRMPSISAGRRRMPIMRSSFGVSTSPPPSRAWCGWTATSTPRPARS